MPVYYNDGLDDAVVYDRQASFVGGQISNFRENLLNESQAELLKDVDAPKNGVLKSRRGFHKFANLLGSTSNSTNVQGIAYFDTDAKEALIVFVNGKIYSIDSSGTVSSIASGAEKVNSATARVYTAQVADKLFYTNFGVTAGSGSGKVGQITWNGSSFDVKEAADAAPVDAKYIVSNNFRAFAYNPGDDQIYVTGFLPNVATTGVTTIFGGTGNNPFKVGLGDPVTGLASWVGFNIVVFCKNSCYVVDTGGSPAASGTVPTTANYTIRTISASTGCVAHGSIAQVGEDLFFLSRTGVRSIRRTMEENMVASDVGVISYPIQDVIDKINWAKVENATAVFWNNRYLLSVPTGTSEVNDTTLCYNTNTQSWTGVWRGKITDNLFDSGVKTSQINPYQFAVTQFSAGKPYLINLDKVGNPLQFRDFVEDINLVDTDFMDLSTTAYVPTEWKVITRAFTFNEQVTTKDGEFVEFEFDRSNAELDIGIILDGAEEQNLATNLVTGTGNLKLDFTLPATLGSPLLKRFRYSLTQYPEFRELQFSFRETTGATSSSRYLALRSIHAGGFLNSVGVES
jgi:hypothetical protein